jgi:hypothetical protein
MGVWWVGGGGVVDKYIQMLRFIEGIHDAHTGGEGRG